MTETIQKIFVEMSGEASRTDASDGVVAARRAFLEHAADSYGSPLSSPQLDELARLDDADALGQAFPWLSDAERVEALWAIGAGWW